MFGIMSGGELLILLFAGLIILGPDKLPDAIKSVMGFARTAKEYLNGTTERLKEDLGPEFEGLRDSLAEINQLREFHPKNIVTKHIFGGNTVTDVLGVDKVRQQFTEAKDAFRFENPLERTTGHNTTPHRNTPPAHTSAPETRFLSAEQVPPYDSEAT